MHESHSFHSTLLLACISTRRVLVLFLFAFPWWPSIFAIYHHLWVFYSAACYRILVVETHHWCLVSCAIVSLLSVLYFFLYFIVTHSIFVQNHKGKLIKKKLKTQKEEIHEVILTCIFMWSGPFCIAMLFFPLTRFASSLVRYFALTHICQKTTVASLQVILFVQFCFCFGFYSSLFLFSILKVLNVNNKQRILSYQFFNSWPEVHSVVAYSNPG